MRTRLIVSAVALIAVVAAVIGTVTTIALRSYGFDQLDSQLRDVAHRAAGPMQRDAPVPSAISGDPAVAGPGQPVRTVGARIGDDGTASGGVISRQRDREDTAPNRPPVVARQLTAAQTEKLGSVPLDGEEHTVELPGLGTYRATAVQDQGQDRGQDQDRDQGRTYVVGIPTDSVQDMINTLIVVELCVTGAGLVAAGLAGAGLVGVALRPLRRMAATARRVSALPLHEGEVDIPERVPARDTDPRTEVGQVGAALNRMLDHVGSALTARHESEQRVRRFVADASHELRTPLASIRGYAELTRRGREEPGPDTRHALTRIESESERMSLLVEDLLLLARLDAGRPLERTETDVTALVVDTVGDARAAGPGHRWRLDLPSEPVTAAVDAPRLHQVLANLLANARTHTPDGTTVTARVRAQPPGCVIEVADDGPGIPPDVLPHVFERFARGDASRSRTHGSTGLGLAIVHAVVTAHGGRVEVSWAPGRTVFTVRL
nr:HAMP domain-containing sensor histidine kinase [Streptomyces boncukensis]